MIPRRFLLLASVSLCSLSVSLSPAFAQTDILKEIEVRPDGSICKQEARKRFEGVLQDLADAIEARDPDHFTAWDRREFINEGWQSAKSSLSSYYEFFD